MLVEFKFKNFRSYRDEAEFSFKALDSKFNEGAVSAVPLEDGTNIHLLRSAVIFGPNASGKSNVILALAELADFVRNSLRFDSRTYIGLGISYALNEKSRKAPVEFEISFIVDGKLYTYSLAVNPILVIDEKLELVSNGKRLLVFHSSLKDENRSLSFGEGWESPELDLSGTDSMLGNQLLLSWFGTKKYKGIEKVYSYLSSLRIQGMNGDYSGTELRNAIADELSTKRNNSVQSKLNKLLCLGDLGITGLKMKKHDRSEFTFPDSIPDEVKENFISQNRWEISMTHKVDDSEDVVAFPIQFESAGTRNLFSVGASILNVLESGGFLAYDEINTALHPMLLRALVSLFNNKKSNPNGAQLLFTTHDSSVADYGLMRADQVWFTNKNNNASELYSAQDFDEVGINVPFEQWYRSGRFGAQPNLSEILKFED